MTLLVYDNSTNYYSSKLNQHNVMNVVNNSHFKFSGIDLYEAPIKTLINIISRVSYILDIIHEAAQQMLEPVWGNELGSI